MLDDMLSTRAWTLVAKLGRPCSGSSEWNDVNAAISNASSYTTFWSHNGFSTACWTWPWIGSKLVKLNWSTYEIVRLSPSQPILGSRLVWTHLTQKLAIISESQTDIENHEILTLQCSLIRNWALSVTIRDTYMRQGKRIVCQNT